MKKSLPVCVAVIIVFSFLTACTNREMGTVGGAAVGGVVGNAVGGTGGAIVGAVGGGVIGNQLAR
jgi:osmotically inducible lipoprotein OsmB